MKAGAKDRKEQNDEVIKMLVEALKQTKGTAEVLLIALLQYAPLLKQLFSTNANTENMMQNAMVNNIVAELKKKCPELDLGEVPEL